MRTTRTVACLLVVIAILLAAPGASAAKLIVYVGLCESGPYDNGKAPDAGWDPDTPGIYVVIPDPTNPPDGRAGFVVAVCVQP